MFQNIVLAGATGSIGSPILRNLLESTSPTFNVTVLVRENPSATSGQDQSQPRYKTAVVDYNDHASLVRALKAAGPADALVSALPSHVSQAVNPLLLRAAQEAGVRRIFPSEFTLDVMHPRAVEAFGEDAPTIRNAKELLALGEEGSNSVTSFTTIVPGMFIDLFLRGLLGVWDVKEGRYLNIAGGNEPFTASSTEFIAASVVAALRMDEEKTKNKRIRIAEVQTTIKEVVGLIEEVKGVKLEAVDLSLEEVLQRKEEATKAQDPVGMYINAICYVEFGGSGAGNLTDGLAFDADGDSLIKRKPLKQLVEETLVGTA